MHYDNAMDAVQRRLLRSSAEGHTYITELDKGKPTEKMGHLGCFVGGLYVLSCVAFSSCMLGGSPAGRQGGGRSRCCVCCWREFSAYATKHITVRTQRSAVR